MSIFRKKRSLLDQQIDDVTEVLKTLDPTKANYEFVSKSLKSLYDLKALERGNRINWNTVFVAGCSIGEVLLILNYEKLGVIASKAMGRIMKGRV